MSFLLVDDMYELSFCVIRFGWTWCRKKFEIGCFVFFFSSVKITWKLSQRQEEKNNHVSVCLYYVVTLSIDEIRLYKTIGREGRVMGTLAFIITYPSLPPSLFYSLRQRLLEFGQLRQVSRVSRSAKIFRIFYILESRWDNLWKSHLFIYLMIDKFNTWRGAWISYGLTIYLLLEATRIIVWKGN